MNHGDAPISSFHEIPLKSQEVPSPGCKMCFPSDTGLAMTECTELTGKVIKLLTIYEDACDGPQVTIEFTVGSVFAVSLITKSYLEAKHSRDEGGRPIVLKDYASTQCL